MNRLASTYINATSAFLKTDAIVVNIITWIPTQYIFTWQLIFKFIKFKYTICTIKPWVINPSSLPISLLFTQLLPTSNYKDREHRDITMLTLPALGRNISYVHHIFPLLRDTTLGLYLIKTDRSPWDCSW